MKTIRVIQLGDIHFSRERLEESTVDLKDRKYPAVLASIATDKPLESALRFVAEIVTESPPNAILFMGDLTDRGVLENYQACVSYLVEVLNLERLRKKSVVHCVPGNHDIDLKSIPKKKRSDETQIWTKFDPLTDAWQRHTFDILATDKPIAQIVNQGKAELALISLNSCVGCGEFHEIDEGIERALRETEPDPEINEEEYWEYKEQVDTPCFASDHLDFALKEISNGGLDRVSILSAHHNLLPQSTPRISPYAELLNGGRLRTQLSKLSCPIIYCHGHIHTDPVELIGGDDPQSPSLITVSAPLLERGFNILNLRYSNSGIPLGLEIEMHRLAEDSPLSREPYRRIRIPFRQASQYSEIQDKRREIVLNAIRTKSASDLYASDLLMELNKSNSVKLAESAMMELIDEMEWHGLLRIQNRSKEFRFWRIRNLTV